MDIRKVKKLMELLEESGMAEIEIVEGKESVRISRYGGAPVAAPVPMPAPVAMAPVPVAAIPALKRQMHQQLLMVTQLLHPW
ncbi:Biotin carboxyl carrier protein of acetyl-CoA carboxylase [uncultured Gammaproteobacteria bacterium]|nr:Biotin carboxyl carrier protein of acetyl-CoA carboxylase [uncultured Gammaproteobacteria bacterium]